MGVIPVHSSPDENGPIEPARRKAPASATDDPATPAPPKVELPRSFPVVLIPARTKSSPRKGKTKTGRKGKKDKTTIVTFKSTTQLLAAVDACTESMRVYDPMASRATVIRMALVEFLKPRGFLL